MRKFTADFETTTDPDDCRVWAYGICEIGNPNHFVYGNSINEFMEMCENYYRNPVMYFHNAKFDFQFIISWLLNNGFECIENKKDRHDKSFTTLITDTGQFYSLEVYFKVDSYVSINRKTGIPKKVTHVRKVKFLDSLKILNFSVEKIAKDFDLPVQKLELDYCAKREKGHVLTKDEVDYLRCDVEIMARALEIMFNEGLDKMTIGSDALHEFKEIFPNFLALFQFWKRILTAWLEIPIREVSLI